MPLQFSDGLQLHVKDHKLEDTDMFDWFVLDSRALENLDNTESLSKQAETRHAIIAFLWRAAFETGEKMPDCKNQNRILFKKGQVFDAF